jgi:lactate permease
LFSFLAASLPLAVVLVMLGVLRRPSWQAALAGLVTGLIMAIAVWKFPLNLAANAAAAGGAFALWPIMWIVFNALVLYNITQKSGRRDGQDDLAAEHLHRHVRHRHDGAGRRGAGAHVQA